MRRAFAFCLLLSVTPYSNAETTIDVCYNWGCAAEVQVALDEARLAVAAEGLQGVVDAAAERAALGEAVGALYLLAGEAAPFRADRAGNWADQEMDGRMDCIDHATSTTRLLRLLERRGLLRFHRVMEPVLRTRFIIGQHYAAAIEELSRPEENAGAGEDERPAARYAVDSWFVDHGKPAVILPLGDWLNGEGPNVH